MNFKIFLKKHDDFFKYYHTLGFYVKNLDGFTEESKDDFSISVFNRYNHLIYARIYYGSENEILMINETYTPTLEHHEELKSYETLVYNILENIFNLYFSHGMSVSQIKEIVNIDDLPDENINKYI